MAGPVVSIRESVGAAMRYVRANLQFVAVLAAVGAAAATAVAALALAVPQLGLFTGLATGLVQAFVYAALVGGALFGAGGVRARWTGDGWRVFAAMAVIGFFLFIVLFVLTIPVMMALFAGPLASYIGDLESAGADEAAVMAVMTRFAEENPSTLLVVTLLYGAVWFFLTSRLYLAAPASVEAGRILTFETWNWTRGATLRIIGARLLLLAPANILAGALGYLAGRAAGVDALSPVASAQAAAANPGGFLFYAFAASLFSFALYSSLEAGLSSALYRSMKPRGPQPGL